MVRQCPTVGAIEFLTKKWTILLLRLFIGNSTIRFNQFIKELKCISPKTLSERLKELEKRGIVSKKVFNEVPPRVEYTLTKKGKDLVDGLRCLDGWATRWYS